jgi:hypothetical protein
LPANDKVSLDELLQFLGYKLAGHGDGVRDPLDEGGDPLLRAMGIEDCGFRNHSFFFENVSG